MAVYAAHLTRTLQGTPSVFQVAAQEALGATVKPALQKVAEYLSAAYPSKCGWCEPWYDELYLLFDCCLQYYYLKHYAASFSESFYGLLRVPTDFTSEFSSGQRLPVHLERASLALLTLVPYLWDKLERVADKWREDDQNGRQGMARGRRHGLRALGALQTAWRLVRLLQLARYAAGRARCATPALLAARLALQAAPPAPRTPPAWRLAWTALRAPQIGCGAVTFPLVGALALRAVEYGAFAVQFLRWWETRVSSGDTAALPTPAPPQRDERSLRWKNKCPLCLQTWKIPTVLPVSGYIFCYTCISRELRATAACPVSRCPAGEGSLVRLYIQ